jgi:hypothetical protein
MDNKTWFRHVAALTLGLVIFYAVSYIVIYASIMNPATVAAIRAASIATNNPGLTPGAEISSAFGAMFPVPLVLWIVGVVLSKWVSF